MAPADSAAVTRTVEVLDSYDRAALVRCSETGRECWIELANADLSPAGGKQHVLTVPAGVAREAGLL